MVVLNAQFDFLDIYANVSDEGHDKQVIAMVVADHRLLITWAHEEMQFALCS